MNNYFFHVSGYSLGTAKVIGILVASIVGGLLMASMGSVMTYKRTFGTYNHKNKLTWLLTPFHFLLLNTLLLILPAWPFWHWLFTLVHLGVAMAAIKNTAFGEHEGDLNDNPFAVAGSYLLGAIGLVIPMFWLCESGFTWHHWISLGICGALVIATVAKAFVVNSVRKKLF